MKLKVQNVVARDMFSALIDVWLKQPGLHKELKAALLLIREALK